MAEFVRRHTGNKADAWQLTPANAAELTHLCGGVLVEEIDPLNTDKTYVGINVPGSAGKFRLSEGDWLVRTKVGGWLRISNREFGTLYEPA